MFDRGKKVRQPVVVESVTHLEWVERRDVSLADLRHLGHGPHEIRGEVRAIRSTFGSRLANASVWTSINQRNEQQNQKDGDEVGAVEPREADVLRDRSRRYSAERCHRGCAAKRDHVSDAKHPQREQHDAAHREPPHRPREKGGNPGLRLHPVQLPCDNHARHHDPAEPNHQRNRSLDRAERVQTET